MSEARSRNEFIMRLLVPTVIVGASLWYLSSVWNARMRDQNLVMIRPVVVTMIPFYFWIVVFEVRRHLGIGSAPAAAPAPANNDHLKLMAIAVLSVALFYLFGAIPATVIVLFASLLGLGVRKPVILAAVPVVTTLVLWLVFIETFGIRMPLFHVPW